MSDIEISGLNFAYNDELVLENINLTYDCNDFLAIIGPNGGGKTTLLKLMLGLVSPASGEIKIFGKKTQDVIKQIGYVPQNFAINPNFPMRVIDVVLMGVIDNKIFGFYSKDERNLALRALQKVEMADFANKKIGEVSMGQRQRIYIARALCADTKILMLDEPTASIDTKGQAAIYKLLGEINKNGVGIVLISHDLNLALTYATKIAYVSKNLHSHLISPELSKKDFITHLSNSHEHFCDVEIALNKCSCTHNSSNFSTKFNTTDADLNSQKLPPEIGKIITNNVSKNSKTKNSRIENLTQPCAQTNSKNAASKNQNSCDDFQPCAQKLLKNQTNSVSIPQNKYKKGKNV